MIVKGYSAGLATHIKQPASCFDASIKPVEEIRRAYENGWKTLCFVGSSCMYPIDAPQPYHEESLGKGLPEKTSLPHAYANYAAYAQCLAYAEQYGVNFFTAIQADVYGEPGTHFIAQIMQRMCIAKANEDKYITIWGDGTVKREPLFIEDADRAISYLIENYKSPDPINVGSGHEQSISQVAMAIQDVIGFQGQLIFDFNKPSGAKRKVLCNQKLLRLGFTKFTDLRVGLAKFHQSSFSSI